MAADRLRARSFGGLLARGRGANLAAAADRRLPSGACRTRATWRCGCASRRTPTSRTSRASTRPTTGYTARQMTNERVPLIDLQQRKSRLRRRLRQHTATASPTPSGLWRRADRQMAKEALWGACRAYERRPRQRCAGDRPRRVRSRHLSRRDAAARVLGSVVAPQGRSACGTYLQPLMLSAVHRRVRKELWWRRWERQGV